MVRTITLKTKVRRKIPGRNIGMANPASVYAKNQGLSVKIITAKDGSQYGMVNLPSGKQVEEWKYYRENYVPPIKKPVSQIKKPILRLRRKSILRLRRKSIKQIPKRIIPIRKNKIETIYPNIPLKNWKKSQTSSGYYKKYSYGFKTLKFKFSPKNKIAPKWSVHYHDLGSGEGYLLKRGTLKEVRAYASAYMRTH